MLNLKNALGTFIYFTAADDPEQQTFTVEIDSETFSSRISDVFSESCVCSPAQQRRWATDGSPPEIRASRWRNNAAVINENMHTCRAETAGDKYMAYLLWCCIVLHSPAGITGINTAPTPTHSYSGFGLYCFLDFIPQRSQSSDWYRCSSWWV